MIKTAIKTKAYAVTATGAELKPFEIERRDISIDKINQAYERLLKSDVRYRFVIDIASLK